MAKKAAKATATKSKPAAKPAKAVAAKPAAKKAAPVAKKDAKEPKLLKKTEEKAPKKEAPAAIAAVAAVEAPKASAGGKKAGKSKKAEAAPSGPDQKWVELKDKHGKEKAAKYSMTGQFQASQPLEHPKLGWGYILNNVNDRLEVLFQDGVKILISNYNPNAKI